MVGEIVEKALVCKLYIADIMNFTSVSSDKDLDHVSESLLIALKVFLSHSYVLDY